MFHHIIEVAQLVNCRGRTTSSTHFFWRVHLPSRPAGLLLSAAAGQAVARCTPIQDETRSCGDDGLMFIVQFVGHDRSPGRLWTLLSAMGCFRALMRPQARLRWRTEAVRIPLCRLRTLRGRALAACGRGELSCREIRCGGTCMPRPGRRQRGAARALSEEPPHVVGGLDEPYKAVGVSDGRSWARGGSGLGAALRTVSDGG